MKKIASALAILAAVSLTAFWFFGPSTDGKEPELWAVEPRIASPTTDVPVILSGRFLLKIISLDLDGNDPIELDDTFAVSIGGVALKDVNWVSVDRIDAVVPAGLSMGLHDVTVVTPSDKILLLADGFVAGSETVSASGPANTIFQIGPGGGAKISGSAKGSITSEYVVEGVPLLKSFRFGWVSDHHIGSIRIKPGSPVPDPSPESVAPGPDAINLIYKDDSWKHEYNFQVEHANLIASPIERRKAFDFCKGECTQQLIRPDGDSEFVIIGFSFGFTGNRDHHIDRIGIMENNGTVTVVYADKNSDDTFKWELEYAYVPKSFIGAKGQIGRLATHTTNPGYDSLAFGVSASDAHRPSAIRGFSFDFDKSGKDRHLQRIGVMTYSTGTLAIYSDKSPSEKSDKFNWVVRWALLKPPRQVVLPAPVIDN